MISCAAARRRRLARLRVTAFPTLLEQVYPTRQAPESSLRALACTIIDGNTLFLPRAAARKSARFLSVEIMIIETPHKASQSGLMS